MRISDWSSDVCSSDLVEREGEQLGMGVLGFVHAALPGRDLGAGPDAAGGQDLAAAVAAVDLQGHVGLRDQRSVEVVDLGVEHSQELGQLKARLVVMTSVLDLSSYTSLRVQIGRESCWAE